MRFLVPAGTAAFVIAMFVAPVLISGIRGTKVAIGAAVMVVCVLWLFRSAWRAPHTLRMSDRGFAIERFSGRGIYAFTDIRKWWFAIPNAPPTQSPPATNGVLYLVLADSTRFRGEVTSEEAARIAEWLPASEVSTNQTEPQRTQRAI
jgi:hypothetical protein